MDGRTDTGTLGKAMDVIEAVATASHPPRFTELLSQVSQPRATLHRQLGNLVEEGLLAVNRDHSYELGLRLLKLAAKAWSRNELRQVAEPHLAQLHELTGETVHLAVLRGVEVIYLDKVESRQSVRMYSQVGNASPAYCTGVGKAALSALPEQQLDQTLRNMRFQRFTDHTITTVSALRSELDAIRDSGVARDREEHEPGIRCIAAPIHSIDRSFVGGISVTGPAFRVPEDMLTRWEPLVSAAAKSINGELGARLGPRT